ncbi:MAG: hypothetical protein QXS92_02405 [Thermofilum sp.]
MPTINVSQEVKEALVALQGFLQLDGKKRYSMDAVIRYLLSLVPQDAIKVDLSKLKYVKLVEGGSD